jgi:hypothetical protein
MTMPGRTTLGFTVTFHSPFRVGAAYASDGVGAALDHDDPLPADHLKGIMRAAAVELLGAGHPAVGEVFGSHHAPSPWAWSSAVPTASWEFGERHRVAIDEVTHSARKEALVLGEQAWTPTARFEVVRAGMIVPGSRAEEDAEDEHVLVLRCAAAGVHGLGAWRRRGLGWVGITPDDGPVTAEDVSRLLSIRGAVR